LIERDAKEGPARCLGGRRCSETVIAVTVLVTAIVALTICHAADRGTAAMSDPAVQLFVQIATVLEHPRCMNCHTGEGFPRQGDDAHRHQFNVSRGPADTGASGLHCSTCHQAANQNFSGVPGAASWQLAPRRMSWAGLSVGELCRALLDPSRGGMKADQFVAHFNTGLVQWAWNPGMDSDGHARTRPPLTHEALIDLTQRWVAAGTKCPP
jgi:hypothetical protein